MAKTGKSSRTKLGRAGGPEIRETEQMFVRLTTDTMKRLRDYSDTTGRAMTHIAEAAFAKYLTDQYADLDGPTLERLQQLAKESDRTPAYIITKIVTQFVNDCYQNPELHSSTTAALAGRLRFEEQS